MILEGVTKAVQGIGSVIDSLHTSEEEKQTLRLRFAELDARMAEAQNKVNEKEAVHRSMFVAGWRPFIGWTCGLALFLHYLVHPFLTLIWPTMPDPELSTMMPVLLGILGLGAYRSYEKKHGITK